MADPFAKDCGCVTHDGPHWLHMDEFERLRASALLADVRRRVAAPMDVIEAGEVLALMAGIAEMEEVRLAVKDAEMRRRGIREIPAEVIDLVRSSHLRWVEENRRQRAEEQGRNREAAETRLAEAATEYDSATPERREDLRGEIAELQQRIRSAGKVLSHA